MAAFLAFSAIFVTSLLVGELAALALGDFFGANDEFPLVLAVVGGFAALSTAVFGAAAALTQQPRLLNGVAILLAILAGAAVTVPGLVPWVASYSTDPYTVSNENLAIALELAIPAGLSVLVQWGLVRRRVLRGIGEDDLTVWPWVATVLAALMLLNPFGLAFVQATLRRSAGDFMWQFVASVTVGTLAVLVVIAAIECYIRRRVLRRRQAASLPPPGGMAGAQA